MQLKVGCGDLAENAEWHVDLLPEARVVIGQKRVQEAQHGRQHGGMVSDLVVCPRDGRQAGRGVQWAARRVQRAQVGVQQHGVRAEGLGQPKPLLVAARRVGLHRLHPHAQAALQHAEQMRVV